MIHMGSHFPLSDIPPQYQEPNNDHNEDSLERSTNLPFIQNPWSYNRLKAKVMDLYYPTWKPVLSSTQSLTSSMVGQADLVVGMERVGTTNRRREMNCILGSLYWEQSKLGYKVGSL